MLTFGELEVHVLEDQVDVVVRRLAQGHVGNRVRKI